MTGRREAAPNAADLAQQVAEMVRGLNHATLPADGFPGLEYPGDAERVLGWLAGAVRRLGQTVEQVAGFLYVQRDRVGLVDSSAAYAGQPSLAVAVAIETLLERVTGPLSLAGRYLEDARRATSGLAVELPDDAGDGGRS